jgi:hyaluronate lyase
MAPGRGGLWAVQALPTVVTPPRRWRALAPAYVVEGPGQTGDAGLAAAVAEGVDHYRRSVLANTDRLQAVHVPSLGLTAANFWDAGTVAGLTASAPCAVLVRGDALTVSDPRRDLDELTVTWAGERFTFDGLAGREGASTTVRLR